MKEFIKIIISISLIIVLIAFTGCSNINNQHDKPPNNNATSTIKESNSHEFTEEDNAKFYSSSVSITGDVEHSLNLTVDSLKQMVVITLDSLNTVCQSGTIRNQSASSRGVLLKDILNKAGIKQVNHTDRNFYIVARASDGYKATFSWAEIFNNPTGDNTYIIFEENNQPITKKGAMLLNCTNDIKTGPRHVNWLKSIEVKRVD